jgi:hypothetical protein
MSGFRVGVLPVMDGWAIAVMPPENQIIMQTPMGGSEPLMLTLGWVHPKGLVLIWLTKSGEPQRPINAYHTLYTIITSPANY